MSVDIRVQSLIQERYSHGTRTHTRVYSHAKVSPSTRVPQRHERAVARDEAYTVGAVQRHS